MKFRHLTQYRDFGLLALRIGLGLLLLIDALPKLFGGASTWDTLGRAIENFGASSLFPFWGLLLILIHTLGAISLILGWYFRLACLALTFAAFTQTLMEMSDPAPLHPLSSSIILCFLFFSWILIGPGHFSLDRS